MLRPYRGTRSPWTTGSPVASMAMLWLVAAPFRSWTTHRAPHYVGGFRQESRSRSTLVLEMRLIPLCLDGYTDHKASGSYRLAD